MNTLRYLWSNQARQDIVEIYEKNNVEFDSNIIRRRVFPEKLYKYCSINEYSIKNLQNNEITMTCPTEFNDVFDSTMHIDYTDKINNDIEQINSLSRKMGYDEIYTEGMTKMVKKNALDRSNHMLDYLLDGFYINSLTTDYKNILMWSHYADNNTGICVEYDFRESDERIQDSIFKSTYISKPIDVTNLLESNENKKISLSVLISVVSKYRDWDYENEWRMVTYLGGNTSSEALKRIQFINIPTPKKIYMGNRFCKMFLDEKKKKSEKYHLIEELLTFISKKSIPIAIAKRQQSSYNLEFISITVDEIRKLKYRNLQL